MFISKTKILNALQWSLTVFMIASFIIFSDITWGKYVIISCAVLIFLMTVIKNGGKIRIRLEEFMIFFFIFTAYVAITALWAVSASDTLTMARTLLRILICFSLVYWAYMDDNEPYRLVSVLVIASYVVALYTVFVYGFSSIINATDDILTTVKFANINSIALFLSLGIICDLYMLLYRGPNILRLISVLSLIIVAFTRSRKSIVFLVLGSLLLLLFRFATSKSFANKVFRIIVILIFVLVALYFIAQLPIFSGVNIRIEHMLNTFRDSGRTDRSTIIRRDLFDVGWSIFTQKPFFGIGFGCTHIVAYQYIGFDYYLHNNYIELLASGGILAFIFYYGMYAYLLYGFIKLRKTDHQWFAFGFTIILLTLITDYGRVSYYSGTITYQIMTLFLILNIVSRNRKEISDFDETV